MRLPRLFRSLFGNKNQDVRRPESRRQFTPALEILEDRTVPTVMLSGPITTSANYSNQSVIVNGNATIESGVTLTFGSGANMQINDNVELTVFGTLKVTSPASFKIQKSSFFGSEGIIIGTGGLMSSAGAIYSQVTTTSGGTSTIEKFKLEAN